MNLPTGSKVSRVGPSQADQYTKGSLSRSDLDPNPIVQFQKWFSQAQQENVYQPETVCLSTASLPMGRISSRMVYLKTLDERGFVIYSNFESRKGRDIESNRQASLCFWWRELERQVRVEGRVEKVELAEAQEYYDTRIRGSRLGAWASPQSRVLNPKGEGDDGRLDLETRVKEVEQKFEGNEEIPVPPFWGGLRVVPDFLEFWQGRESRLHDRFRYLKARDGKDGVTEGGWKIERLAP